LNTQVEFTCKINCSNPKSLTYYWTISLYKEDLLINSTQDERNSTNLEDTYIYMIKEDFDYVEVNCSITNGVFESILLSETFKKGIFVRLKCLFKS
jgi:hypothetical protein